MGLRALWGVSIGLKGSIGFIGFVEFVGFIGFAGFIGFRLLKSWSRCQEWPFFEVLRGGSSSGASEVVDPDRIGLLLGLGLRVTNANDAGVAR